MRKGLGLLIAAGLLAGCGSSSTTTPTPTLSQAEPVQPPGKTKAAEARQGHGEAEANNKRAKESQPKTSGSGPSFAQKIVEAWKQKSVSRADLDVRSIQLHLTSLTPKCSQNEATLAGYVKNGVEILKKAGINKSPVELARALDAAAPPKKVVQDCKSVLAGLLVQLEKGG
jgi:hypothetical protein